MLQRAMKRPFFFTAFVTPILCLAFLGFYLSSVSVGLRQKWIHPHLLRLPHLFSNRCRTDSESHRFLTTSRKVKLMMICFAVCDDELRLSQQFVMCNQRIKKQRTFRQIQRDAGEMKYRALRHEVN